MYPVEIAYDAELPWFIFKQVIDVTEDDQIKIKVEYGSIQP